jgi:hypothetical protein
MLRTTTRPFTLPYEPEYTAHRTSKRQLRNARMLVHVHANALRESPSIAPDFPGAAEETPSQRKRSRQDA